jgi:NADH dehydrogenase [ubiquinone] 1 alpha subcomplex assembly factor 6
VILSPIAGMNLSFSYCARLVRGNDRDRFLTALFAPADRRESLLALYAFNAEVARIREAVREPILGQVRLQWWHEALDSIYAGSPPAHEVAEALAGAVSAHRLTRALFDRILDAREFDLGSSPPDDLAALVSYAEATSGALNLLALEILDPGGEAKTAACHIGIAWALVGLLRATGFHARTGRIYLPKTLLDREGVDLADIFASHTSPGLRAVAREIANLARRYLAAPRPNSRPGRAVWLQGVVAESYLSRIERAGFNPFAKGIEAGRLRRQLRLWLAAARM